MLFVWLLDRLVCRLTLGQQGGCLPYVIAVVALLSVRDPMLRPAAADEVVTTRTQVSAHLTCACASVACYVTWPMRTGLTALSRTRTATTRPTLLLLSRRTPTRHMWPPVRHAGLCLTPCGIFFNKFRPCPHLFSSGKLLVGVTYRSTRATAQEAGRYCAWARALGSPEE